MSALEYVYGFTSYLEMHEAGECRYATDQFAEVTEFKPMLNDALLMRPLVIYITICIEIGARVHPRRTPAKKFSSAVHDQSFAITPIAHVLRQVLRVLMSSMFPYARSHSLMLLRILRLPAAVNPR
nr:hypothetical protein CFP56_69689 [Quercus suber]